MNPEKDKIITIQYQELERNTAKPVGDLIILKEWESSEKKIIEKFLESGVIHPYPFKFVPIGYNLNFEHKFLKQKTEAYGLPLVNILDKPTIDLRAIGVIMNNGEFKGSGLDKITEKPMNGSQIPTWYENKEYWKIIEYIEAEAKTFIKFNEILYRELPQLRRKISNGQENHNRIKQAVEQGI